MNSKLIHISIFLSTIILNVQSQQVFKKDTSYTVISTYNKLKSKFPHIEIVKPVTPDNVTTIKNSIYKEIGHRKLFFDSYIFNENENQQLPAIILIHGGGWKSGDKSMMEPLAQVIASKGYACFTVEYRLSTEAIFPAGIIDIKSAIRYIKQNAQKYRVNPNKVTVLGGSSGGQMAALIGATNNNKDFEEPMSNSHSSTTVHAIIDMDGILAFKHALSQEGEVASLWLGGNYLQNPTAWIEASALNHVGKNTPPMLFIGSQYPRFLAGKNEMISVLNSNNIYNQVEIFPDSPHSFWLFHPWFNNTTICILKFLDKVFQ